MLDSGIPFKLRVDKNSGFDQMLPDEQVKFKEMVHQTFVTRQFAKCVGRGALKLGTIHTVPTEKLMIPVICTTALLPPDNKKLELKADHTIKVGWADFHNGVATGLQLATEFDPFSNHIKNWILFHKPPEPKDEFGGFLMSMGFHGYLKCFQKIEIYQYMKTKHEAYTVGLCLGGAASLIGTADESFSKALCVNISYLHPRNIDIEICTPVQCAALVGEGLLFKGSNFRQVTEMLLTQLGKRPLNSKNTDRESYTLSAGFALGIVNLGSGSDLPGMSDLNIDERLIRLVEGGKQMDEVSSMKGVFEQEQCSSVKEGSNVNLYVTLPGGIVALALIHLKTNNQQIADRIEVPKTFFALEYSRPSDVMLKVLCRNLILWDNIDASKDWLTSQIPEIIRNIYNEKSIQRVEDKYQTRISIDEINFSNIAMLYTYLLTGALFSIGFKYAGSGNRDVFKFLNKYIESIITMKVTNSHEFQANIAHKYTNSNKNAIDKRTYETCLCVASFAISMVMAGTGDVDCFVTLRRIRKILEHDMHYGFNMAIHTSIGFLFLGSGKYTFSTSNLSIASLLMALYPKFPDSTTDNRYHLQALRHFYVLAIENRLLQSVDIETGELVSVPLEVEYKEAKPEPNFSNASKDVRQVKTPIMLEDMHKISRIHLNDQKYYEIIIDKPEIVLNLQKNSHSVFARASNLVDKSEFAQKSISKVSIVSPFDVSTNHQAAAGWIPKMIFVKKKLPIECENSDQALLAKTSSSLAPFAFSKSLSEVIARYEESKARVDQDDEGDEEEDTSESAVVNTNSKTNDVSAVLTAMTKSPVIRKFLQIMCEPKEILYSELEPIMMKGMSEMEANDNMVDPEQYFEIMNETEETAEELENDASSHSRKVFSSQELCKFYLSILYECFQTNKIEMLPNYLWLFNSSTEYKNSTRINRVLQEGKLISMFYNNTGLYESSFVNSELSDAEENDDFQKPVKNISKPQSHTLLKKQFVEELEEVMTLYNKFDDQLPVHLQEVLTSSTSPTTLQPLSSFLTYKKYPYTSQILSLLILIEVTRGYTLENDREIIQNLFQQKFGIDI